MLTVFQCSLICESLIILSHPASALCNANIAALSLLLWGCCVAAHCCVAAAVLLQEAALTRVSRMKDRFQDVFALDESKTPRTWKAKDNIPKLARDARLAAANVLAQLAVERPADYSTPDVVEQAILRMARQDVDDKASSSSSSRDDGEGEQEEEFDLSSATSWPGVAAADVLIQPHEARMAWREFMSASSLLMQQVREGLKDCGSFSVINRGQVSRCNSQNAVFCVTTT